MTPREALDRIAALCDQAERDAADDGDSLPWLSVSAVRAVLAEAAPERDMPSPLTDPGDMQSSGPETYRSGGVLDRDQARAVLRSVWNHELVAEGALARLAAAVRPAAIDRGVTLTPEEAAQAATCVRMVATELTALAARLGRRRRDPA